MARTEVPTYTTNQLITSSHANTYWRDNLNTLWPYTTAGDLSYASAADALARLGIGTAGHVLKVSSGGVPQWAKGAQLLDWCLLQDVDEENIIGADWQDISGGSDTLTLPVAGVVIAIATAWVRTDGGNGWNAFFRVNVDGAGGQNGVAFYNTTYYSTVTSFMIKACSTGDITVKMQAYAYSSNKADIQNASLMAFAFPS